MPLPGNKIYPHGNYLRYLCNGCRCPDCRRHASFMRNKSRVQHWREGPSYVPIEGLRGDIAAIRRVGWTLTEISRGCGVSRNTLRNCLREHRIYVLASTYDKVHALWQDVFGENGELVDVHHPRRTMAGSGKFGPRLWPWQTLRDKLVWRDGRLGDEEARKVRGGPNELWNTARADRVAVDCGFLPWEVWDGWSDRHGSNRAGGDVEGVAGAAKGA